MNNTIQELIMSVVQLVAAQLEQVSLLKLSKNSSIQKLDLSTNEISDDGTEVFLNILLIILNYKI